MSRTACFRHERSGHAASFRTESVQMDAGGHRFHMVFPQAGCRAVVARIRAMVASCYALPEFFLYHTISFYWINRLSLNS